LATDEDPNEGLGVLVYNIRRWSKPIDVRMSLPCARPRPRDVAEGLHYHKMESP